MIGDKLRAERERQNLTIQDIAKGTSIRALYIEAIEKGEYGQLPGTVYAKGFISTMSDEYDRRCVAELVADVDTRVYPVGRLDRDSEGLLLFTNDGEFANSLMHPSKHVPKTYRVTVRPEVTDDMITKMMTGMMIDGQQTLPADVKVLVKEENRTVLEVTICEGRNRQIRKMCEQLGLEVARLKRISEGPVKLGMLQPGKWRELTHEEVQSLKRTAK